METQAPEDEATAPPRLADRFRASATGGRLERPMARVRTALRDPDTVLALILLLALGLRLIWLNEPGRRLIFDEAYYVNAARVIVGLEATSKYVDSPPGLDPNREHPPLGKLLIGASIMALGDNGIGWRIPSVIAGMFALIAVYRIVRAVHRSAWLAVLAVALLALDNLTFVHGRMGTLDMLALAPMLIGAWLALERRWLVAGAVMGIALLVKLTALYGVVAVLLYVLLTEAPAWWRARRPQWRTLAGVGAFVLVTGVVAIGGLAFLDAGYSAYASPFDHIQHMVSYGASLRATPTSDFCPEIDSRPWQWLVNECQIPYLRTNVSVREGDEIVASIAKLDFRGAMNPVLVGSFAFVGAFAAWFAWRRRSRLAVWAIAWAVANYLPYVILAVFGNRITYIYYMLPVIPAVAVGLALLLLRTRLPPPVKVGFLVLYVVGFVSLFPFRSIPS